jgi:hypothetical protein
VAAAGPADVFEAADRDLRVFGRAARQPGELVVLGVHVRGERLQVDDQHRLEVRGLLHLAAHQADGGGDGVGDGAFARDAAVHVIDERRVELLLRGQRRLHGAPDEGGKAALPAARGRRVAEQRELLVERRDLMFVGPRRRMRQVGQTLHGGIHGREGRVVARVGGLALALQAREVVLRHRARDGLGH